MKILVANLGSTSLKYRLFELADGNERMLARGGRERVKDHAAAISEIWRELVDGGQLMGEGDLAAVGFKPVHARGVTGCRLMDEEALKAMEEFETVAPAHTMPYVSGIRLFRERLPNTPLVGLFESAFYQWAPEAASIYAVPEEWARLGVRRYGFHGASHKFIAERSAELLGREDVARRARDLYITGPGSGGFNPELRVISCHLGGSSSITGIQNGLAIGNSMGMSPQSGLPQNNRTGDLDPFAAFYAMERLGLTLAQAREALAAASGLKGLTGGLNDMRDISERATAGDAASRRAIDFFIHESRRWIGSYWIELGGLEALVFTGGMGENDSGLRAAVCAGLEGMGLKLDPSRNSAQVGEDAMISAPDSRVKALVIRANEELVIAREVGRFLLKGAGSRPFARA
jgi:acetate kinase